MVEHPLHFAVFVGHVENGPPHAFEVWVNGSEQPRGLGALAKTLSMDMRANDHGWLKLKLDNARQGRRRCLRHAVPAARREEAHALARLAFAQIVRWRVDQLHAA